MKYIVTLFLLLISFNVFGQNYIGNATLGSASIGGGGILTNAPTPPPDTNTPPPSASGDTNLVVGGMGVWFRAASLTNSNGTAVGYWDDTSTNNSDAVQATTANKPILENGFLRFHSATNQYLVAPHNENLTNTMSGLTMFVVFKTNTIPATEGGVIETMFMKGTNWLVESVPFNVSLWNNKIGWFCSDVFNLGYGIYDPKNLAGTNYWLMEVERNIATSQWDGKSYNTDNTTNSLTSSAPAYALGANVDPLYIGTHLNWAYTSGGYNGWIREIIIWPRKLTLTERSNLLYYATSY